MAAKPHQDFEVRPIRICFCWIGFQRFSILKNFVWLVFLIKAPKLAKLIWWTINFLIFFLQGTWFVSSGKVNHLPLKSFCNISGRKQSRVELEAGFENSQRERVRTLRICREERERIIEETAKRTAEKYRTGTTIKLDHFDAAAVSENVPPRQTSVSGRTTDEDLAAFSAVPSHRDSSLRSARLSQNGWL